MKKSLAFTFLALLVVFAKANISDSILSKIIQLTNVDYDDIEPKISANGYIVWVGYDSNDNEIYLAAPPLPDIKANGSDGPLTISAGDPPFANGRARCRRPKGRRCRLLVTHEDTQSRSR